MLPLNHVACVSLDVEKNVEMYPSLKYIFPPRKHFVRVVMSNSSSAVRNFFLYVDPWRTWNHFVLDLSLIRGKAFSSSHSPNNGMWSAARLAWSQCSSFSRGCHSHMHTHEPQATNLISSVEAKVKNWSCEMLFLFVNTGGKTKPGSLKSCMICTLDD